MTFDLDFKRWAEICEKKVERAFQTESRTRDFKGLRSSKTQGWLRVSRGGRQLRNEGG